MSFLQYYKTYVQQNEAPSSYHLWSAFIALASFASRRVWIDQGYFRYYPNIYVVLVGPPALKKTTAMNISKKLVFEVGDVPFSSDCVTKEALVDQMQASMRAKKHNEETLYYSPMTIYSGELSEFLGASTNNMISFLTDIYNSEFYKRSTRKHGDEIIKGPHVIAITCTTPDYISARLKDDVISGGFSRRAIFVLETEETIRIPRPQISNEMREAWVKMVDWGRRISKVCGEFVWTDEASAFYDDWYINYERKQDPAVRGYYACKFEHVLKLSMLLSLSETTDLIMHKRYLVCAIELLEQLEKNLPLVFQGVGRNELSAIAIKILTRLDNGPLPLKQLMADFYREANGDELFKIFAHLKSTGDIEQYEKDSKQYIARIKNK